LLSLVRFNFFEGNFWFYLSELFFSFLLFSFSIGIYNVLNLIIERKRKEKNKVVSKNGNSKKYIKNKLIREAKPKIEILDNEEYIDFTN
jgi:hypothetical protein